MTSSQSPHHVSNGAPIDRGPESPSRSAKAGAQALRVVVFVAGLGLLVGFFLPWLRFGEFAAVSGLSLMVSSGQAVDAVAGPARGLLILIPACGAGLIAASAFGPRMAVVAALAAGIAVLGLGLFTLARVFLETMGAGMWIVAASALLAAGTGVAGLLRSPSAD